MFVFWFWCFSHPIDLTQLSQFTCSECKIHNMRTVNFLDKQVCFTLSAVFSILMPHYHPHPPPPYGINLPGWLIVSGEVKRKTRLSQPLRAPPSDTHTHAHKNINPSPHCYLQSPTRGTPLTSVSAEEPLGSHCMSVWRLASCHQQPWDGDHTLAQHGSTFNKISLWSSIFMTFILWLLIHHNYIFQSRQCSICGVSGAQQVL